MMLLQDPAFWVAVSTVLCVGFIGYKAAKPLLSALDARAHSIRTRLDEAASLHAEAQAILNEYKAKAVAANKEAEDVLAAAKARAEKVRQEMEAELKTTIARMEASAQQRIARMENEALEAIKSQLILESMNLVRAQMQGANNNDRTPSIARITNTL